MTDRRPVSAVAIALAVLALLLPALYVGGYFALGETAYGDSGDYRAHIYRWQWVTDFYKPAGAVESAVTGCDVDVIWEEELVPPSAY